MSDEHHTPDQSIPLASMTSMLRFQKAESFTAKHGYFKGTNVTKYLKTFNREMKLCRMTDDEMRECFIDMIDDVAEARAQLIIDQDDLTWAEFQKEMKDAFKSQDADRPDADSFLEWVNGPKPAANVKDIYADFCLKYRDLGSESSLLPNKVRIFIQAVPVDLRKELLDKLLEDNGKLTTSWDRVKSAIEKSSTISELCAARKPSAAIATVKTPAGNLVPHAAPAPDMEELTKMFKEMVKINTQLQKQVNGTAGAQQPRTENKPNFTPRCVWCDSTEHSRRSDCKDCQKAIADNLIAIVNGRIRRRSDDTELPINYNKGGMMVFLKNANTNATVAEDYGDFDTVVMQVSAGELELSTANRRITADAIRKLSPWDCPIDVLSIDAYVNQLVTIEEKRARTDDETRGNDKRQRQDVFVEIESPPRTVVLPSMTPKQTDPSTKAEQEKKRKDTKPSYKLESDLRKDVDFSALLEDRILDAEVAMPLRAILQMADKQLHTEIIDRLRRKRQIPDPKTSHPRTDSSVPGKLTEMDTSAIQGDENIVAVCHMTGEAEESDDVANHLERIDYHTHYWSKPVGEVRIFIQGLAKPITALVDSGSEVNVISKDLWNEGMWPIDRHCGWGMTTAGGEKSEMFGACPELSIRLGNVFASHHAFVKTRLNYPVILGTPWMARMRCGTQFFADGTCFGRILCPNSPTPRSVQFLLVPAQHKRARTQLSKENEPNATDIKVPVIFHPFDPGSNHVTASCSVDEDEETFRRHGRLSNDERIGAVCEDQDAYAGLASLLADVEPTLQEGWETDEDTRIEVSSVAAYALLSEYADSLVPNPTFASPIRPTCDPKPEEFASVCTMYKTVDKKVKPVAVSLPSDSGERIARARTEPAIRPRDSIGHVWTKESLASIPVGADGLLTDAERHAFRDMLRTRGRAFAFNDSEIGCADPSIIPPMIIFCVPHTPWNLRPITVPKAHADKLVELLKKRMDAAILRPSSSPYSNRWFTVPKKSGELRFIQDLQPANKVTIRNTAVGPSPDEFSEDFAGKAIYSMGDLYSGYDQFQLALESRDITAMKTPLGLLNMQTLPQGATNSVAHIVGAMNNVLSEFIPDITRPFIDDLPMKGCTVKDRDDALVGESGVRRFVADHIGDVARLLDRLIEVGLTLSGKKSEFGMRSITTVGYICSDQGRAPDPKNTSKVADIEACQSITEVRRFLGALGYYRSWIPHYGHIANPLYELLRKNKPFRWDRDQEQAMNTLKAFLASSVILRPLDYSQPRRKIYLTVDTSPYAAGWVLSQDDNAGTRRPSRFGARSLSETQSRYGQIKRELWGMVVAFRVESAYLVGAEFVVETDCLPLVGQIKNCTHPDSTVLRWLSFIHSYNPTIVHIGADENLMADMLSRSRFRNPVYEPEVQAIGPITEIDSDKPSSQNRPPRDRNDQPSALFRQELYLDSPKFLAIGTYLSQQQSRDFGWTTSYLRQVRLWSKGFSLINGLLFKTDETGTHPRRVIGLNSDKISALSGLHEQPEAGHRGQGATIRKLHERFFWHGMTRDARFYVESCAVCQQFAKIRIHEPLLSDVPRTMHHTWHLDIVHLTKGRNGKRYAVIAREALSNWAEGRALSSKKTSGVCQFVLEDIVARFGCPARIRADRGELDANEAREFFERLGIRLELTTAYNPEANGKSERGHPPIVDALVKDCVESPSMWPLRLPYALWADRTTVSRTTGYSPAELMLGFALRLPVDETLERWFAPAWEENVSTSELLVLRMQQISRRDKDLESATQQMKRSRDYMIQHFDKTHRLREKPLEPSDLVLLRNSALDTSLATSSKFERKWLGPYVVIDVDEFHTYRIAELDGAPLSTRIAAKRLKLFRTPTSPILINKSDLSSSYIVSRNDEKADRLTRKSLPLTRNRLTPTRNRLPPHRNQIPPTRTRIPMNRDPLTLDRHRITQRGLFDLFRYMIRWYYLLRLLTTICALKEQPMREGKHRNVRKQNARDNTHRDMEERYKNLPRRYYESVLGGCVLSSAGLRGLDDVRSVDLVGDVIGDWQQQRLDYGNTLGTRLGAAFGTFGSGSGGSSRRGISSAGFIALVTMTMLFLFGTFAALVFFSFAGNGAAGRTGRFTTTGIAVVVIIIIAVVIFAVSITVTSAWPGVPAWGVVVRILLIIRVIVEFLAGEIPIRGEDSTGRIAASGQPDQTRNAPTVRHRVVPHGGIERVGKLMEIPVIDASSSVDASSGLLGVGRESSFGSNGRVTVVRPQNRLVCTTVHNRIVAHRANVVVVSQIERTIGSAILNIRRQKQKVHILRIGWEQRRKGLAVQQHVYFESLTAKQEQCHHLASANGTTISPATIRKLASLAQSTCTFRRGQTHIPGFRFHRGNGGQLLQTMLPEGLKLVVLERVERNSMSHDHCKFSRPETRSSQPEIAKALETKDWYLPWVNGLNRHGVHIVYIPHFALLLSESIKAPFNEGTRRAANSVLEVWFLESCLQRLRDSRGVIVPQLARFEVVSGDSDRFLGNWPKESVIRRK